MKIIFENYNMRYTVESEAQDFNSGELKDIFSRMLVQAGFTPSVIDLGDDGGSYMYVGEHEVIISEERLKELEGGKDEV